jgi:hypothetical protein
MLNFEYFLSLKTQLNYKNDFGRKILLGRQFTLGTGNTSPVEVRSYALDESVSYGSHGSHHMDDIHRPEKASGTWDCVS